RSIDVGSVAEIAAVLSPTAHGAIDEKRTGVSATRRDGHGIRDAGHWRRGQSIEAGQGRRADLAGVVSAPAAHAAVAQDGARMCFSTRDSDDVREPAHAY